MPKKNKMPILFNELTDFLKFLNPKNKNVKHSKMMNINFLKNNNTG